MLVVVVFSLKRYYFALERFCIPKIKNANRNTQSRMMEMFRD